MKKLVLFRDDESSEFVALCDNQEYLDNLREDAEVIATIDIEGDLGPWPTNRPLSADF